MGRLERIWIKRAKMGPMDERPRAALVAGKGLVGNANQGGHRQVTVISRERWAIVCRGLGAEVEPSKRRANLLVSGIDLEASRGKVLRIGAVRLRVLGETRPCDLMDRMHDGLQDALRPHWGGGCYGEVLDDGEIEVGQAVDWHQDPPSGAGTPPRSR